MKELSSQQGELGVRHPDPFSRVKTVSPHPQIQSLVKALENNPHFIDKLYDAYREVFSAVRAVSLDLNTFKSSWITFTDPETSFVSFDSKGDVIAWCTNRVIPREECLEHGSCLYIQSIGVISQWRGMGIGKRLMHQAAKTAIELGIEQVRLDVLDTNKTALEIYLKYGFRKDFVKVSSDGVKQSELCVEAQHLERVTRSSGRRGKWKSSLPEIKRQIVAFNESITRDPKAIDQDYKVFYRNHRVSPEEASQYDRPHYDYIAAAGTLPHSVKIFGSRAWQQYEILDGSDTLVCSSSKPKEFLNVKSLQYLSSVPERNYPVALIGTEDENGNIIKYVVTRGLEVLRVIPDCPIYADLVRCLLKRQGEQSPFASQLKNVKTENGQLFIEKEGRHFVLLEILKVGNETLLVCPENCSLVEHRGKWSIVVRGLYPPPLQLKTTTIPLPLTSN